ncbi:MAG: DUF2141 domain-containing protein [Nannocystaceae bacterium]
MTMTSKIIPFTVSAAILLSLSVNAALAAGDQTRNTINVKVAGVGNSTGKIRFGLYDSSQGFPDIGKEMRLVSLQAKKGTVQARFENVPAGTYALAVFHDENSNGSLDKNMLGIPKEDFAFSNNARGMLGPPTFKKASFQFSQETTLSIVLTN